MVSSPLRAEKLLDSNVRKLKTLNENTLIRKGYFDGRLPLPLKIFFFFKNFRRKNNHFPGRFNLDIEQYEARSNKNNQEVWRFREEMNVSMLRKLEHFSGEFNFLSYATFSNFNQMFLLINFKDVKTLKTNSPRIENRKSFFGFCAGNLREKIL